MMEIESQLLSVGNVCNPSIQETQAGWLLEVQVQHGIPSSSTLARATE